MLPTVNDINNHPVIAFALSILGIGTGTALQFHPDMVMLNATVSHEMRETVVAIFQCFAYAGGGIAGLVAGHGWLIKRSWYIKYKSKKKGKK